MNVHLRSGSKAARRIEVGKVKIFVHWAYLRYPDIQQLQNLGKAHVHAFFKQKSNTLAAKTLYDYKRALRKFWIALERPPYRLLETKK